MQYALIFYDLQLILAQMCTAPQGIKSCRSVEAICTPAPDELVIAIFTVQKVVAILI